MTTEQDIAPMKLILVGSSGVGKTSLITSFIRRKFEPRTQPTVSPAFCAAPVDIGDNKSVDLQIWDTAGQEMYLSISQMFYRDADFAFVCATYENFEDSKKWPERIREYAPDCLIFLVITKKDLLSEDQLNEVYANAIEIESNMNLSGVYLTSAFTNEGVQECFRETAKYADEVILKQREVLPTKLISEEEHKSCC